MMPQKRNPDILELIRGRCGNVYGDLFAFMTILKSDLALILPQAPTEPPERVACAPASPSSPSAQYHRAEA